MGRSILTSGCTRVKECIAQIICDKKSKVYLSYNHQCPALANQTFHIALCSASKCDQTINMVPTLACDQSTQCTARQSGVNDQKLMCTMYMSLYLYVTLYLICKVLLVFLAHRPSNLRC